jgi:hypothetical protein
MEPKPSTFGKKHLGQFPVQASMLMDYAYALLGRLINVLGRRVGVRSFRCQKCKGREVNASLCLGNECGHSYERVFQQTLYLKIRRAL